MPTVDEMFPMRFICGSDLQDQIWTLTIDRVELVEVYTPPGIEEKKWAVYFGEAIKGLILNKTNANQIAIIVDSMNTDDWSGHKITLYPVQVKVGKSLRIGIRVRKPEQDT
jgi:hypothetical protein